MLTFRQLESDAPGPNASSVVLAGASPLVVEASGPFWTRVIARGQRGRDVAPRATRGLVGVDTVEDFVRSPGAIRALGDALSSKEAGETPAWVLRAIELIEAERVPSLTALADFLGVNRVHFARSFAAHVGFAPSEFRSIVRVCDAMRAIERGEALLQNTARRAGYTHQSHMTREFRAMLGLTPGEWRWRALAAW